MVRKLVAEVIGTFWLVLAGCGSVVFWGGVDIVGTSLAFGLAVVTMAYTVGGVSGCHLNPAVSVGLFLAGKFPGKDLPGYVLAQCAGAVLGAVTILAIAKTNGIPPMTLGANGFGEGHVVGALVAETVLTFVFVFVILGATSTKGAGPLAGLAIGLCLTLIHIVGLKLTGVSVNPARSLGPALIDGGKSLAQVWVFLIAPVAGACLAAFTWKFVGADQTTA
jgi:aquaporin Z